jgi:ribosomal protein S18 acetylase RimI-like enzyme
MTSGNFSASVIDLGRARLAPLASRSCPNLAAAFVAMPPWSVMRYPEDAMRWFLATADDGVQRYLVEIGGEEAGAVSVRFPWLKGPYLELLALLSKFQGQGIGARLLDWFEEEAGRHEARNLWVCTSSFNERALRFYKRHGFMEAASLPSLVADGYTEILLRKFPLRLARGT